MQIFREIASLKAFLVEKRLQGHTIGFVPTMGALHEGHISLIRTALNENSVVVCSIFVNPAQFNNPSDLDKYPRTLESDTEMLKGVGCQVLFCPEADTMYARQHLITFDFGDLDKVMEGAFRPGHFSGVALVVSKLFHIVEPDNAYFGQKDWQQYAIIKKLVEDLSFNLTVKSLPTMREGDGLAMSSRNMRLTPEQRMKALILYRSLMEGKAALAQGNSIDEVKQQITAMYSNSNTDARLEYFEVVDSENLNAIKHVSESQQPILCTAAYVGDVRLIDNMFL
jgi:pantoate--beta-alanine ligase